MRELEAAMDTGEADKHEEELIPDVTAVSQQQVPAQTQTSSATFGREWTSSWTRRPRGSRKPSPQQQGRQHAHLVVQGHRGGEQRSQGQPAVHRKGLAANHTQARGLRTARAKKRRRQQRQQSGQQRHVKMTGWQPQHIILGGWVGNRPRHELEEQAASWMRSHGQAYTDMLLPA